VVFTNKDDEVHSIVSAATPPLFHSGALDTDDSFANVFSTPGTYAYFCSLHPHMHGTIIVT
jgi:plastocyanin